MDNHASRITSGLPRIIPDAVFDPSQTTIVTKLLTSAIYICESELYWTTQRIKDDFHNTQNLVSIHV